MKTTEIQNTAATRAALLSAWTKQQTKAAYLCLCTVFVLFALPHWLPAPLGEVVMGVGSAVAHYGLSPTLI